MRFKQLMVGLSAVLMTYSCSEGDTVFDKIVESETRGAVLRTVEVLSNEIAINADGSIAEGASFGVILEEQDQEGGKHSHLSRFMPDTGIIPEVRMTGIRS